jgi:polysaccharide export outer membrane protein
MQTIPTSRHAALLLAGIFLATTNLAANDESSYRFVAGDLIRIEVYDHEDLSRDIRIPQDGSIAFPLLGDLPRIAGMSELNLRTILKERLEADFLQQAVISTSILEYGPRLAYIMGSVQNAGSVELSPFSPMTAMQAIGAAGGFNDEASRSAAQVIRDDPRKPGAKIALSVPTDTGAQQLANDITLQHNDIIVVPRLDRVYIIGRVAKPGALNLPSDQTLTVSKAVSMAGGFEKYARKGQVQLIRGGATIETIDVDALLNGDDEQEDPKLQPGDTVFVPERGF